MKFWGREKPEATLSDTVTLTVFVPVAPPPFEG